MQSRKNDREHKLLVEIGEDLKGLSIEMSALLWEYKEQGLINEREYEDLVKIKQDFIRNH